MAKEIKQQVGLRLTSSVRAAAEKAAADDSRTLSALIEKTLVDHLKAKGYLPAAKSKRK